MLAGPAQDAHLRSYRASMVNAHAAVCSVPCWMACMSSAKATARSTQAALGVLFESSQAPRRISCHTQGALRNGVLPCRSWLLGCGCVLGHLGPRLLTRQVLLALVLELGHLRT